MSTPVAFIPGRRSSFSGLLARYLPPIPAGVAQAWLRDHASPGDWIIDPFGISPLLPYEAAMEGYRVLVVANNPIARFLLELTASPLPETEMRNALARLSMSRIGEQRLEPFINDLYATTCEHCGQKIIAQAFLWEREASAPYARLYQCPHCRDEGERAVTQADTLLAEKFGQLKLHQARALELIAPPNDPYRPYAQDALSAYLPRAIYALFTIKNRMDSLKSSYLKEAPTEQRCLNALFLHALDQANTLWAYPSGRTRPRQMTSPPRFRENNVWLAMEEAINILAGHQTPVPLFIYPKTPPSNGGVTIFEGRLKELTEEMKSSTLEIRFRAALTAMPRYNPAYYTLSALWAGWLWGRRAVNPFKSALRRRRYDWSWYTNALFVAFNTLTTLISPDTPFLGLIGESEPSFLASILIATTLAGFDLQGVALRVEKNQAQIHWKRGKIFQKTTTGMEKPPGLEEPIARIAAAHLRERGEPATYPSLHAAILSEISTPSLLPPFSIQTPAQTYIQTQGHIEKVLMGHPQLLRYGGSEKSPEVGLWWLKEPLAPTETLEPLSDRIERGILNYLRSYLSCSISELDAWLCKQLPGLLTPDADLISACLNSYGEPDPSKSEVWHLRKEDFKQMRQEDVLQTIELLRQIGRRLGYIPNGDNPLIWMDATSSPVYTFFITSTAIIGSIVLAHRDHPPQPTIVIPGSRADLIFYKIHHNPYLKEQLMKGWHFLKFRHVRRLADAPLLTPENFNEQVSLDPLTDVAHQMRLW